MTITKNETADLITIAVSGRLDKVSSPQLSEEMKPEVEKGKDIVFDLKDMTYISSAGLRVFFSVARELKARGKKSTIINVNSSVMDIFNITGFTYMLDIKQ